MKVVPTHGSGSSLSPIKIHLPCHEIKAKERLSESAGIKPVLVNTLNFALRGTLPKVIKPFPQQLITGAKPGPFTSIAKKPQTMQIFFLSKFWMNRIAD